MRAKRSVLGLVLLGLTACGSRGADLIVFGMAGAPAAGVGAVPDVGGPQGTGGRGADYTFGTAGMAAAGVAGVGATAPISTGGSPTSSSCWQDQLPPEAEPLMPRVSVAEACSGDIESFGSGGQAGDADARAVLVGRWVPCGTGAFRTTPHAGIEFGANGRYALLMDSVSGLVPLTPPVTGRYNMLSTGQLNLRPESSGGMSILSLVVGRDALGSSSSTGGRGATYARVAPSPLNGRDNPPSISDGTCTLVGTWDTSPAGGGTVDPQATFSFDEQGNFVGGPVGADLCSGHTMYGTYQLSPGVFMLTTNIGMGLCHWWFDGGWSITFGNGCGSATLRTTWDNCTGGRRYLNNPTVLTKRP